MYVKKTLTVIALAVFAWAGPSSAALIYYNFDVSGVDNWDNEVSVVGKFSYNDETQADEDGIISYSELNDLRFTIANRVGTASATLSDTTSYGGQIFEYFLGSPTLWDTTGSQSGLIVSLAGGYGVSFSLWTNPNQLLTLTADCYWPVDCSLPYVSGSNLTSSVSAQVPEPTSLALLSAGVMALGVLRREKPKLVD